MKRSKHSLSHYKLLTCNMGELVPIGLTPVLPGDTFQHSTSLLVRTVPLVAPVMHPVHVKVHHFFVPTRLIWEDWENFITGGPDGEDASVFPYKEITSANAAQYGIGTLADYLGSVPNSAGTTYRISALPFRAYALIFNEFYRDQDLVTKLVMSKASGADNLTTNVLQKVAWEKDYFTTARPEPQKGPAVTIPLGGTVPIVPLSSGDNPEAWTALRSDTNVAAPNGNVTISNGDGTVGSSGSGTPGVYFDPNGSLIGELDEATAVSINDLRRAFAIQRYEEARSMYGSRYTEYLRYLGVRSSDARLQRPEYLGGGKQTIQFSEVLQTAPAEIDSEITDTGTLRGHGIGAVRSNRYRRFFEEHGFVVSLMSVRPRAIYSQAMARHWFYTTKFDFFQKELMHLGQQEIYKREVAAIGDGSMDDVLGYQDRYDDWRRIESTVAGQFRKGGGLEYWHMARQFESAPTLNAGFVTMDPTDRIYAETTSHELQIMASHNIKARRIVPKFAKPLIM